MTAMKTQDIFPVQLSTENSESTIKMEGQKVVFDKKVALLPVDIRKEETTNIQSGNGRTDRRPGA